jgi:predicted nucleotide-binding protein
LTRANLSDSWVNFDAWTFVRTEIPVVAVLLDLDPSDLTGPLAQLQSVTMTEAGIRGLVRTLNGRLVQPLPEQVLERAFQLNWPDLAEGLRREEKRARSSSELHDPGTRPKSVPPSLEALSAQIADLNAAIEMLSDRVVTTTLPPPIGAAVSPQSYAGAKPRLFIGSSVEGKRIAESIQTALEHDVESVLWTQEVFAPSYTTMESLVDVAKTFDFAVIVMTADDILIKRGVEHKAPRDNLIFEVGLFTGMLGRARTFVIHPRDGGLEFPTDFRGVTLLGFDPNRSDRNLFAAVGPVCTRMKNAMGLM